MARDTLTWDATADAESHDVVRGDLLALHVSGGDFAPAILACVEDDGLDLTAADASRPAPGGSLFWLVRASGCGVAGSWDSDDPRQLVSRDTSIAGSAAACP